MRHHIGHEMHQEDKKYLEQERKKKADAGEKYLHEFSDSHFEKITNLGLKVIECTLSKKHIFKVFYHEETHELKVVRNLDDFMS